MIDKPKVVLRARKSPALASKMLGATSENAFWISDDIAPSNAPLQLFAKLMTVAAKN